MLGVHTLKLLGRIFDPQKNNSYSLFAKIIQKIPKQQLVQCNFAQFFGNEAEEKYVILLIDCYSQREMPRKTQPEEVKPPNLFSKESDYEFFLDIYARWKAKSLRK